MNNTGFLQPAKACAKQATAALIPHGRRPCGGTYAATPVPSSRKRPRQAAPFRFKVVAGPFTKRSEAEAQAKAMRAAQYLANNPVAKP